MRETALGIVKALLFVDLCVIAIDIIFFDINLLYSSQIGYISSSLVMIASMISYRRMVNHRVANGMITMSDDRDAIEKLDDPYDLYSEEIKEEAPENLATAIKEEKQKLKANRRSFFQTLRDTKAALSFYRIGSYVVLVLGFLYLNRHGLLHIPTYIISLGLPSVIIVVMLLREKQTHSEDTIE